MSAESNMLRPASRQISTSRVASATSLVAPGLEELIAAAEGAGAEAQDGHLEPEPPSCRYSIVMCLLFCEGRSFASFTDAAKRRQTIGTRRQALPGTATRCEIN